MNWRFFPSNIQVMDIVSAFNSVQYFSVTTKKVFLSVAEGCSYLKKS